MGLVSELNPSVGAVMGSGFGFNDSFMCLYPLLLLLLWFFFRRAAWMGPEIWQIGAVAMTAFASGAGYAGGLIHAIYTSISFPETFSSTFYYLYVLKLLSFVAIGVYFSWQALSLYSNSRVAIKGERRADAEDPTV